jgi:hypothetical protein
MHVLRTWREKTVILSTVVAGKKENISRTRVGRKRRVLHRMDRHKLVFGEVQMGIVLC